MLSRPTRIALLVTLVVVLVLLFGRFGAELYTEALWFDGTGYSNVLWTQIWASLVVRSITTLIGAVVVAANLWLVVRGLGAMRIRRRYGNLEIAEQIPRRYVRLGAAVVAIFAGWWLSAMTFGGGMSLAVLAWVRHTSWGLADPVFGRDLAFYVFSLPVYARTIEYLLLALGWGMVLALVGYTLVGAVRWRENRFEVDAAPRMHFAIAGAAIILLFAWHYWIGRYGILLDGTGFDGGVGYTDIHARLPARRVLAVLALATSGAVLYGGVRKTWWPPVLGGALLLVAGLGLGTAYPAVIQRFQVEPNELARESPYIEWALDYTRRAYGLAEVNRVTYDPSGAALGGWDEVAPLLERVSIWDAAPLQATFDQRQAVRPYFTFRSVVFDRYGPPGRERVAAVGVREFQRAGLEVNNQTWRTLRLNAVQVRGWGAVLTDAAIKAPDGGPVYWIEGINPITRDSSAAPTPAFISEPNVFFSQTAEGEDDYVILGASDPSAQLGTQPANDPADLDAGIPLNSFLRIAAFALRFGEHELLFASEIRNDSSRLLMRRHVVDRLRRVAPFVLWDSDVFPVLVDGRIVWMADGYTVTASYPLSARVTAEGRVVHYMNDALKATVDAATGEVAVYAISDDDPMLATFARVFPGLVRPLSEMPPQMRRHLRYPTYYQQIQATVLESFHVVEAAEFFSGENVWQVSEEQGGAVSNEGYRPIPLMTPVPGDSAPSFVLVTPFNARQRQNMTAILMVRNDPERYGEHLLLEFPRNRQVTGPLQVQTLIEQEPDISAQLSLWRTQGSDVGFGRLRVLPLQDAVFYIQPVFLSASGDAIPQLQRVIVSDGTSVNMALTLPDAVNGLYSSTALTPASTTPVVEPLAPTESWAARAAELVQAADAALRAGDLAGFGEQWAQLQELIRRAAQGGG